MRKPNSVRLAIALLGAQWVLGTALAASPAAVESVTYNLDIPAQSLNDALQALALASKHELLYPAKLVDGMRSVPLKGKFTTAEAVKQLLAGTDLEYEVTSDGLVVIRDRDSSTSPLSSTAGAQGNTARLAQTDQSNSMRKVNGSGQQREQGKVEDQLKKAGDPDASKQENQDIKEVVVTAQKRAENLQDVPISMSVLRGEELDRSPIQGVTEALSRVPGVALSEAAQGGGTKLTVRGVTAAGPLFTGPSPIAYYIDSTPFGFTISAIAPDPSGYDLDRVEVLRGPQGTLFGAGGVGGVVRVLTKEADPNEFELKARTSIATTKHAQDESYRGDVALNVPLIGDKLGLRAVAGYNDMAGWVDGPSRQDLNDATLGNFRLKLKATPNDNLDIGLSAWRSESNFDALSLSGDGEQISTDYGQPTSTDFSVYGLTVNYRLPSVDLTSSTSYIDYTNYTDQDLAPVFGLPWRLITDLNSRAFSQEILVNSTQDGPWEWAVGTFYRDAEDSGFQPFVTPASTAIASDSISTSESYAVFGELRRNLHKRLKLTLGLRYFHDDSSALQRVTGPHPADTTSSEALTPRVVLTWLPSDDLTTYASYSQGFRAGLPQDLPSSLPFETVDPDKLHNYEIGAKGSFLDQRLAFDLALYYIDWQGIQQVLTVFFDNGLFGPGLVNGTSASGPGFDLSVAVRPIAGLELGAAYSWNDLTQDEDVFLGNIAVINKGARLGGSPEGTISGFAEYAFPMGSSGYTARLSGSVNHTSEQNVNFLDRTLSSDNMLVGRASFAIEAPRHWGVTLYAENVNNERNSPQPGLVPEWDSHLRPRTLGVQFEYRY